MQPLSTEEAKRVEQVAEKISTLGLQTAALLLIDVGHPFAFIGSQLMWVAQPAASLFVPRSTITGWATLLEKPSALTTLKQRLLEQESAKATN